ncbi:hypothetical protein N752_07565 [Desulforamulus aquiferis]|nr:hypothetical protein N752_07565 [Desulforamulus aquiferis]
MRNLEKTLGLVFSQRVLLALVDKGLVREKAYELVQRNAMEAWRTGSKFQELLEGDAEVMEHLNQEDLAGLFDYNYHLKHVDDIYARFGL